jgi:hypothetical protein
VLLLLAAGRARAAVAHTLLRVTAPPLLCGLHSVVLLGAELGLLLCEAQSAPLRDVLGLLRILPSTLA